MNIVVRTYKGNIVIRPDTTWTRKKEDFYVPDFVNTLSVSEVLCARISRSGKCISGRFAERYYDSVGRGMLFYPENLLDGSEESYATALCLSQSTYIPVPCDEKSCLSKLERDSICSAICDASAMCVIRIGDFVAVETGARHFLCSRDCGRFSMPDFDIIF